MSATKGRKAKRVERDFGVSIKYSNLIISLILLLPSMSGIKVFNLLRSHLESLQLYDYYVIEPVIVIKTLMSFTSNEVDFIRRCLLFFTCYKRRRKLSVNCFIYVPTQLNLSTASVSMLGWVERSFRSELKLAIKQLKRWIFDESENWNFNCKWKSNN